MTHAISIDAVSKRFASLQALDHISFTVEHGEFFALLGPNGAGKTTLISAMAGLSRADSGQIRIMGHDTVAQARDARMKLGVVPQELVFDPFFTVRETLTFQSGYFGIRHNDAWIDELLHKLGLTDKANVNMRALSGGMKRRVMVAQALVHRPPVIVLDEPTAGVDVELRQSLWAFVKELNAAGHTIVLTTHYLEEAEALCSRIAMMKKGRLIALENKDTLLSRSAAREVSLQLSGPLPASLQPLSLRQQDGRHILALPDIAKLEQVLSELRLAAVEVRELSVHETDLEQVFVKLMHGGQL
ncbi:ABC transporter ATP-binding protein [Vogesella sp. EB]|jgi:ABC-2 type transport system ATP-binding protein|uniref:ABC transporter ATP-binding protein n=1 Tax=unclassified Vogesella TaxID=2684990 RepID=UPI00064D6392|nr:MULTISPECIES: ABC transporter ATP-binding protein [unclassified Vogesella]KMJ52548.1 ABC transporter ATP-binding protein [Vogesella sp. EB]MCQ4143754.1 ABC transporter ATP-binding protein [Vogesella sp. AC12]